MSPFNHLHHLRTGSSFYKATREDGLYSAVKFFPFEFSNDQAIEFEKRVSLVKKAVNDYQADIPHIIDWRVKTEKPFIEFDWIVGMSFTEKFKIERNSLLTISDVSEVAEQVSKTITLCHKIGLQHGAVSMKEIIWDAGKKRYALTGFFSNFSTSQQSSEDLQKKDIKDLSIVLLQLLTGREDVDGMDEKQANLARENAIPPHWSIEDKRNEKEIPSWLWQIIAAGMEGNKFSHMGDFYFLLIKNNKHPLVERNYRSKPFAHAPTPSVKKVQKVSELYHFPEPAKTVRARRYFVFDGKMAAGFLVAALLFGFSMFSQKKQTAENKVARTNDISSSPVQPLVRNLEKEEMPAEIKKSTVKKEKKDTSVKTKSTSKQESSIINSTLAADPDMSAVIEEEKPVSENFGFYMVKSKAYFHNKPDDATKRKGFIIHWNNAILVPEKEENEFFYVVFTNKEGRTSKGWLKKSDLVEVGEK